VPNSRYWWRDLSPTSKFCHLHIWSPTSLTNIDVTFKTVTVMLVTSLCWWLYDGYWFQMLVAESLCWWLFSLGWWFLQFIKSVTNILNRSPTSHTCHQHIRSPTSVTNIDVTFKTCYPPVHAFRTREFSFDEKYVYWSKAEIFWCQKSRVSETYKRHLLESWPVTEMIQLFTVSHILHSKINCIISIFMLFKNFIILELSRFLNFHEFFRFQFRN